MIKRRIPVLQLIDSFATEERSGGAAQFGIQLARHLDHNRYASFVCGLWRYDTPSEQRWRVQLHDEGIGTTILIEQPGQLVTDMIRAAALLGQLVTRVQPCIINSHFERGDLLALWRKLIDPTDPCIVRTMHTDQQWQTRPWLGQLLNLFAFPWFFDAEVAISEATRQVMDTRLAARLRGQQSVLLYNGISSALLQRLTIARQDRNLTTSHAPRVAIVGRLEPQKGHIYFLQAGIEILRYIPNAELWIVGTGSLLEELRALAELLKIGHAVRFWGSCSDVPKLLLDIDILVSSSIWEGFPTVILEAMAARVPVVATDVSGSRELVRDGETGLLVPVAQPKMLAEAVLRLLSNRHEAQRMADEAWRQSHLYSLEHTANGYDRLYCRLLISNRRQRILHIGNVLKP